MPAWANSQISDGQAGMSKQGGSPDYEYRRQLRECHRHEASDFHSWWCFKRGIGVYYESPTNSGLPPDRESSLPAAALFLSLALGNCETQNLAEYSDHILQEKTSAPWK
jgi:hypothetical protein